MSLTSITSPFRATGAGVELSPWPLRPESVIAGDPRPHGHVFCRLESDGSQIISGIYTASPGALRSSALSSTETIHVLEGEASIELSNGHRVDVAAGDVAVIPAGIDATWTFHSAFKEVFILTA